MKIYISTHWAETRDCSYRDKTFYVCVNHVFIILANNYRVNFSVNILA